LFGDCHLQISRLDRGTLHFIDYKKQDWAPHTYFAPGRYGRDGAYNDPYGYWLVETMTMPLGYKNTGYAMYDFAVASLSQENSVFPPKFIGDHVGYAGLAEVNGFEDPMLDSAIITGYPGDLDRGRAMWTMGQCPSGFINATQYWTSTWGTPPAWMHPNIIAFYDCDITSGTSGSSILGSDKLAWGVNAFAMVSDQIPWNGGPIFVKGNGIIDLI
jgi:V8-like Glu-specific endopeptidase